MRAICVGLLVGWVACTTSGTSSSEQGVAAVTMNGQPVNGAGGGGKDSSGGGAGGVGGTGGFDDAGAAGGGSILFDAGKP
jgi:hypothetical protein